MTISLMNAFTTLFQFKITSFVIFYFASEPVPKLLQLETLSRTEAARGEANCHHMGVHYEVIFAR